MGETGRQVARLMLDAFEWAQSGGPYPPESIRNLPTSDQAQLAQAAHELFEACQELDARAARLREGGDAETP